MILHFLLNLTMVKYRKGETMKIQEVIVVEGKNDTAVLKSYFNCDTIETHGTCLSEFTLQLIEKMQKARGVIIFTDPDYPGESIRKQINQRVSGCKNAFVPKEMAKTDKKVGVEHASKEVLEEALKNCVTFDSKELSMTLEQFQSLGLSGKKDSACLREKVSRYFRLGHCNAKTLYKRLCMASITYEEVEEICRRSL